MPSHRWRWATVLLVVATLVAAACGGDDDDDDAAGDDVATTAAGGATTDATAAPADTGATTAPTSPTTLAPQTGAGEECGVGLLDDVTEPVEIEFWHSMSSDNQASMEDLVAQYNASQDRVHVTPLWQGTYDETAEKFRQTLGGDLPQVIQLEETQLRFAIDSGAMLPVQDCVDGAGYSFDDYLAPVVDEFVVEGQLWPMPFNTSSLVMYYDRAAFTAAGLDPDDPPATLDELRTAAEAIVASGYTQTGFSMILESWWVEQWIATSGELFVDQGNGRDGRSTELLLGGDAGLELFRWIDGMIDDGLATSFGIVDDASIDYVTALIPGGGASQAAFSLGTSAFLGAALDLLAANDFAVELGVAPLPTLGAGTGGVTTSGAALWIVAEGTEPLQRAASWDFVQWLDEPEQQATWHEATGYLPNTTTAADLASVQALWAAQPAYTVAYDQLFESQVGSAAGPVIGAYNETRQAVEGALEDMVLSGLTPEDAVAQARQEASDAMAAYNDRVG
jgi:sn-glycerol 3-phosphate transport system substrate-binding protein